MTYQNDINFFEAELQLQNEIRALSGDMHSLQLRQYRCIMDAMQYKVNHIFNAIHSLANSIMYMYLIAVKSLLLKTYFLRILFAEGDRSSNGGMAGKWSVGS